MDIAVADLRLSVVVPTRGRPRELADCLAALGRSTLLPGELELVAVGDGHDVSRPAVESAVPLTWRTQPRSGPAAARNLGASLARAPVVAFTDDDCRPDPEWAERMLACANARPEAVVAGRVRNGLVENGWAEASHLVLETVIEMYNGRPGRAGFAPSSNLALRRDVFEAVGGFDESFTTAAGEDREFCDRCFAAGHPLVYAPGAVVEHHHDLDFRGFLRQYAAYGRGEATYRAACARQRRDPNVVRRGFYHQLARSAFARGFVPGLGLAGRVAASQLVFVGSHLAARRPAPR